MCRTLPTLRGLRIHPSFAFLAILALTLGLWLFHHYFQRDLSQHPFAIVIVGGLMVAMLLNLLLLPTLYVWVARYGDVLPAPEASFREH